MLAITSILEDPTIKYIFSATGNLMNVSDDTTPSDIVTIMIDIPKSQVAMLDKKGVLLLTN